MKKQYFLFVILILVLVGGATGYYFYQSGNSPNTIELSGNIEVDDVAVGFQIPGKVEVRNVNEGDTVRKGQQLAQLDRTEHRHEVRLRESQVEAAQARLDELLEGPRSEVKAQAREKLQQLTTQANQKRRDYFRARTLHEKDHLSEAEFEHARTEFRTAQQKVDAQRQKVNELVSGPRSEKIRRARAEVKGAEQQLALAKTRLGYTQLRTPVTGRVLADHVEPGEYVQPGLPVVTIGSLRDVWLRAYLEEPDLGRVKLGMPVEVSVDSYSDRTFEGRLSFIADEAEFTPKTIQTEKERTRLVYQVKIDVKNPEGLLKPGMPADAVINLDE